MIIYANHVDTLLRGLVGYSVYLETETHYAYKGTVRSVTDRFLYLDEQEGRKRIALGNIHQVTVLS